ncbi:Male sterility protein [Arenibacter nanhaiticus]|uniref:Male sterility protein n=1 Tax=Arenibacter nanhaiticus TaxID=558155 RepID=A0A1M6JJ91_9FLAO|nr:SDR family oxidoreductase [Arenibacter nanhaiticus]SHJ46746.1 Male sterility protein [Arenibacter nanhaiticus]
MNIILTGATGTLGSRVLFSLLEIKFERIEKIYLPVRNKKRATPEERISNMFRSEYAPEFIKNNMEAVLQKVAVINADRLLEPETFLGGVRIDYFVHSAGYVNLSTHAAAKEEIFRENLDFTKSIFKAYVGRIAKFVYISTAFAIGDAGGLLGNNYGLNDRPRYRNFYEASKHASERFLLEEGKKCQIPIQILRPSVLGGNISEAPNYFISKYMVFYLFAKFFNDRDQKEAIRISTGIGSGLNIIPTDYAAKVIVKVLDRDIEELNIVHSQDTNLMRGMSKIFDVVGFANFSFTQEPIETLGEFKSALEKFYYQTIGVHLHPYLTSRPNQWDTELLESILPIPDYNIEDYLSKTVSFAKTNSFRSQNW